MTDDAAYLLADAEDRRAALHEASIIAVTRGDVGLLTGEAALLALAERNYHFLRNRDTLRAVAIEIIPGTPYPEGSSPVTATVDLSDTNVLPFTLTGLDAKDAQVAAPTDTWAWTLNDPDQSGAVLTVSADTLSATVAAGVPTVNLSLSVAGQATGLQGAESIIVQASAATTIGLVPGTPAPETPATPPAG